MKRWMAGFAGTLVVVSGLSGVTTKARAQITLEMIGPVAPLDISGDGTVVVGNAGPGYETFRWTATTGAVLLGRSTADLGIGAGTPDVSLDGTRISATIADTTVSYATQGLWKLQSGWIDLMPPTPPDAGMIDGSWGSAWGLSGDGNALVGLYWRGGQPGGTAHASVWKESTGVVDLGSTFGNSRANDANFDGSVIVGWDEASNAIWRPAVWVDGVLTILRDTTNESFSAAHGVNEAGDIIVGQSWDPVANQATTAVWRLQDGAWVEEQLGFLFGTHPVFGAPQLLDLTEDGRILVGANIYNPGNSVGVFWTEETGLVNVEQWLLQNGVTIDPEVKLASLTGISLDGSVICGIATEQVPPFGTRGFLIHTDFATSAPVARLPMRLEQNFPNPFNPTTTIPVVSDVAGSARLEVVDLRGRRVQLLHEGILDAGRRDFTWNGVDERGISVSSGTYFARLTTESGTTSSRGLSLVK